MGWSSIVKSLREMILSIYWGKTASLLPDMSRDSISPNSAMHGGKSVNSIFLKFRCLTFMNCIQLFLANCSSDWGDILSSKFVKFAKPSCTFERGLPSIERKVSFLMLWIASGISSIQLLERVREDNLYKYLTALGIYLILLWLRSRTVRRFIMNSSFGNSSKALWSR